MSDESVQQLKKVLLGFTLFTLILGISFFVFLTSRYTAKKRMTTNSNASEQHQRYEAQKYSPELNIELDFFDKLYLYIVDFFN